ncbi:MAG: redoxin domain-containing protein [Verrucomicrobiota bacterium]
MQLRAQLRMVAFLALGMACGPSAQVPVPPVATYPTLVGQTAPSLDGALTWFNGPALKLEELRGKVVLLQFFDYSCINCIRTYPYLIEWDHRYSALGLQIIGVHAPQYEFSTDPANVLASVRRYNLAYPIAVDSHLQIAGVYSNRFWPRQLILDRQGVVRFDHTGEGGYADAEKMIQTLLREVNPTAKLPTLVPPVHDFDMLGAVCYPATPELYLGRLRGQLANPEVTSTNAIIQFHQPESRVEGKVYATGDWSVHDEYMRHAVDKEHLDDCLTVKYRATEVNIVMKPESIYWMQVFVEQDGHPLRKEIAGSDIRYDAEGRSFVRVDAARMYNVIDKQPYGQSEIRFSVRGQGLSVYSFSFGTCAMPKGADTFRPAKESE